MSAYYDCIEDKGFMKSSILSRHGDLWKHTKEIIKSLGVVFGDIGTSPIYTLSVIFLLIKPTAQNVMGVLSLIIWTLVLLVTVQYAWLAMSLGKKGEGGTIVLRELLVPLLRSEKYVKFVTFLSFIGIALFIGDGVITPAVSILSAVEGILLIPCFAGVHHYFLIALACIITIILFFFQRKGTERMSIAFGPLMVIWFTTLSISGFYAIKQAPTILYAFNPWYAIVFFMNNGLSGFFVLSGVILCATGGEALYADMGHLGRKPIIRAWYIVLAAMLLTYLGQGAFLLQHPGAQSVLYEMIFQQISIFYIPFLILSMIATVIASQAMISGIFSVVYQGITTNIMPMFKVDYTSNKLRSQVYIGAINWLLLLAVLWMIIHFQHSHNLAAAYGLAVTGTMTVTGIMMSWIFFKQRHKRKTCIAMGLTFINIIFLLSNTGKIPLGGYWSLIIAFIPLSLILIYTEGQKRMFKALCPMPLETFLDGYNKIYNDSTSHRIHGAALFFVRDMRAVQPYVVQTMFTSNIIYEENIMISVITRDDPFGVIGFFKGDFAPGLRIFEIHMGYMEVLDIEKILHNAGIHARVVFYGQEEIVTKNIIWKIYSLIKKLSPSFVQFYKIPAAKLHGVETMLEM